MDTLRITRPASIGEAFDLNSKQEYTMDIHQRNGKATSQETPGSIEVMEVPRIIEKTKALREAKENK